MGCDPQIYVSYKEGHTSNITTEEAVGKQHGSIKILTNQSPFDSTPPPVFIHLTQFLTVNQLKRAN